MQKPAPTPAPDPAREVLAELLACRRQITAEITRRRQQRGQFRTAQARARLEKARAFLEQERDELEALLRETVQADAAPAADCDLPTSLPSCGPILALTLLAEGPELGHLDRCQIAAPAGLAPIARDSGTRQGRRAVKGGRGQVRNLLSMAAAAMLRARSNPFQGHDRRLVDHGKPRKLALTAVMRRMLVTLNALLRTRSRWKDPDEE